MFAARAGRVVLDMPWKPCTRAGLQTKIKAAPHSKVMAEHRQALEVITPFYPLPAGRESVRYDPHVLG